MKHDKRFVRYFDCKVAATVKVKHVAAGVVPASFGVILQEIDNVLQSGARVSFSGLGDTQTWNIQRIELDVPRQRGIILVNRSDQAAADQAISDPVSSHFSVARKSGTQGNAYSSHIVVDYGRPTANGYLMLIEDAVGITSKTVSRLLSKGVTAALQAGSSAFLYPHPDGTNKKLKGRYNFEVSGHPSQQFVDELNNGHLKDIQLISKKKKSNNKFDAYNATEYVSEAIHLKPKQSTTTAAYSIVKSVCGFAAGLNMEQVRIQFMDRRDIDHTVYLDSFDAALVNEDRFVKREVIQNFSSRLDTAFEEIQSEIRDRMYYLLK